ncbi:MAG: DUF2312 domain-containing protein [Rickettsiaceae bacterium H1]|nr:DUF2312 domain-containing protein [Rickettsiaceae bacterium H1]
MTSYKIEADLLKQYVANIERTEEEKARVQEELKEIYSTAKNRGVDVKALRQIVKLRKMDNQEMIEQEEIIKVYKEALGMK